MEKKIPKVFANTIDHEIKNNNNIYTSSNIKEQKEEIIEKEEKTINQKIKEIINAKKYLYTIPVTIKTQKETIETRIIGKNDKNIITMDNKLIKISEIEDIRIIEK